MGSYLTDAFNGDIRFRKEISESLSHDIRQGIHARKVMESYQNWLGEGPELSVLRMLGLSGLKWNEIQHNSCGERCFWTEDGTIAGVLNPTDTKLSIYTADYRLRHHLEDDGENNTELPPVEDGVSLNESE